MRINRSRHSALLLLSFVLPIFLYLAVMIAARVTPFGNNTLLLWDANYQNTAFLTYWQRVLGGEANGLFSFSRTLGGNMIGMIAFYLASPLNVLLLLPLDFPLTYSLLVLVKIGLSGLTFMVFLRRSEWKSLFFSTTYALCGFVAVYFFRVEWLDAVILLPLTALGIRHIHEGRKPLLYILSLGMAMLSQYYFGYMLCVFSALYFLYHLPKWRWKTVLRFGLASVLAAGLAAAVLIPVYQTLSQGHSLFSSGLLSLNRINTLEHLLTKFYTAAVSTVQLRGNSPNYYVGIPMLVFVMLYLCNGSLPLRRRLRSLLFIALFALSFWIAAPYYAWHAFDAPNGYPARFSFLFSFLLIEMGFEGFRTLREPKKRLLAITAGFAVISFLIFRKLTVEYLAYKTIVFDVAACTATCLLLMMKKRRTAFLWLIILMQFAGLFLNGYYAYRRLSVVYTATASGYTQEVETVQALIDRVQAEDNGFFRMEKDFHRNDNDSLLYDYRGISHMSSDLNQAFMAFCKQIGLHQGNYHLSYRAGTTPVLESLLGVQYILRKDGIAFEPLPEGYEELWRDGDVTAFQNTYALPLAYLAPPQTLTLTDANLFVNQNTLLSDLTGEETRVFAPVWEIERTYDGTWETYTFPVQANKLLYMKSSGEGYVLNGTEKGGAEMNGSILLPVAQEDTVYELQMTGQLGIHLAYFDLEAFQQAHAILAAHTAQVESDTDSRLVIHAEVTGERTQLLITIPYDDGWQAWVDGKKAETTARYGALLAVDLTEGTHTVELRFMPVGLWAGAAVSAVSLAIVVFWMILKRKKTLS